MSRGSVAHEGGALPEGPGTSSTSPAAGDVAACRAKVPVEPKLVTTKTGRGGPFYTGQDPTLIAWLKSYLEKKASAATGEAKRGTLAFASLQGREGSTAAINGWDDQVFTWGTGWSGLGGLPGVMKRLVAASPAVVKRLADCGVRYVGDGVWSVEDSSGKVVTGKKEALEVIRSTPALVNLFIDLAKDPATREAVADAQLGAFLATSASIPGSETIGTQALYTFATHLAHWAPGWAKPAVKAAAAQVPGDPSADRDVRLAPAIVAAFYEAAPAKSYVVTGWNQLKGYVRDMAKDGLDVTGDPVLSASSPPGKTPIAGFPLALRHVPSQETIDLALELAGLGASGAYGRGMRR